MCLEAHPVETYTQQGQGIPQQSQRRTLPKRSIVETLAGLLAPDLPLLPLPKCTPYRAGPKVATPRFSFLRASRATCRPFLQLPAELHISVRTEKGGETRFSYFSAKFNKCLDFVHKLMVNTCFVTSLPARRSPCCAVIFAALRVGQVL